MRRAKMLPVQTLGRCGVEVTSLGLGGYLGQLVDDDDPGRCEAAAIEAVRRAVELGVRYFDTSPAYGRFQPASGDSTAELHLGAGLAALTAQVRRRLVISTKAGTHPQRRQRYGADDIRWSFERSRRILGPIDILFVHDPGTEEQMDAILAPGGAFEALERLKEEGQIRAFGLGVRNHRFLRRAIASRRVDVVLPSYDYHPIRQSLDPLLDEAAAAGVGVVNGSPYQAGLLAGIDLAEAGRRRPPHDADLARARQICAWCASRGVPVGAVAVQFSGRDPRIGATLVGPRTAAEVESGVAHATADLPEEIWEALAALIAGLRPPPAPGGEAL